MQKSSQFDMNYTLARHYWDLARAVHRHGHQFGEFTAKDNLAVLYYQDHEGFFGITNEQELVHFFAPQRGSLFLKQAIKMGARHLSCYAPLVPFYYDHGFNTYRIEPFDSAKSSPDWRGPEHSMFYMQYVYGE